jgi:hypothetical protein
MPDIARRPAALFLLLVSLAAGSWLRLSHLDTRSITHPEMYVPNIPLPEGMSEPVERRTVSRILTGTFSSDTHPPGYYLLMLPWTRAVGTSLEAMRLPSAIFGIACVVLVFALGVAVGSPMTGAIAAAMLGLSGYHVFWSQVARMFALACFLGLSSTLLMIRIARGARHPALLSALYVIVVLAGVSAHVFFWSLFATQLLWALGNAVGKRELPAFCRAQLLALIAGSPLTAFAAYQSGNTVADLSGNVVRYLAEFISFAFVLPSSQSGFFPGPLPFYGGIYWVARGAILLIAIFLLMSGLRSLRERTAKSDLFAGAPAQGALWTAVWIAAGVIATVAIAGFVYLSSRLEPGLIRDTIRLTKAMTVLPLLLTAITVILNRYWGRLRIPDGLARRIAGEGALLALLGTAPFLLLASVSAFRPLLNQRGLLFASPYLLTLLAAGLMSLQARWRMAIAPALVAIFACSLASYSTMTVDPGDYGRFARQIQSEIQPGELVFIRKIWSETPILYYLRADKYRLVGKRFVEECAASPDTAVWLVLLNDVAPSPEMQRALSSYHPVREVKYPYALAIRYEPGKAQTTASSSQTFEK